MNSNIIVSQIVKFFIYVLLQILIFQNIVLFDKAFCYVYVAFLLLLPFDTEKSLLLMLGFIIGIAVDIFDDTIGMHAAASVLIMFLRPYWIKFITPRGGFEGRPSPVLKKFGARWFTKYVLFLIFVHHGFLFFIKASSADLLFLTFTKIICSVVFTYTTIMIIQYLFYNTIRSTYD